MVVGGARGIGKAYATALLKEGAKVGLTCYKLLVVCQCVTYYKYVLDLYLDSTLVYVLDLEGSTW